MSMLAEHHPKIPAQYCTATSEYFNCWGNSELISRGRATLEFGHVAVIQFYIPDLHSQTFEIFKLCKQHIAMIKKYTDVQY